MHIFVSGGGRGGGGGGGGGLRCDKSPLMQLCLNSKIAVRSAARGPRRPMEWREGTL